MSRLVLAALLSAIPAAPAGAQVIDKQKALDAQTFWDNRDWDWYKANIPFFECPDPDITTTYYYRWELVTKHLTYGSPNTGYVFTEFIDRPFWSGTYGAISCPAGHQLYEVRWLRDPRYARDYARYWFRTPGAEPRRYSCWLADAVWAVHLVHPDKQFTTDLLPDLVKNYEGWEKEHFDKDVGLFWQTGHDDGMEYNINSRQTKDIVRGAPGYRPTLNAYMAADALAIANIAALRDDLSAGARKIEYAAKALMLWGNLEQKLWDPKREFFYHMAKRDETVDKFTVKALSLTYQTGQFAGDKHGRELIGYVPWQFGMPGEGKGYEVAWKLLTDKDGFAAPFGPTTVERHDPLFRISPTCCWWSGNSWPYATTQTLKALANLLQFRKPNAVTKADYFALLQTYAKTHRKDGKPYIAEACNPDTGSWDGHDSFNHSEHYFHSGFCDLVITGLVGLRPRDDETIEVRPLAPETWAYFALESLPYRGRTISVVWDRDGKRYNLGKGLHLVVDGKTVASRPDLGELTAKLPAVVATPQAAMTAVNFAVNNDGTYFPRVSASFSARGTTPAKAIDGNYWYHVSPPNRWTCEGSPNASEWLAVDLGKKRKVNTAKLYFLDDGTGVVPPEKFELEHWDGKAWVAIPGQIRNPEKPAGRRANIVRFPELEVEKVRVVLHHAREGKAGLTEFELWGDAALPVEPAPNPPGNLAFNPGGKPFPKASASFTSRFDKVEEAIDGKANFSPGPRNRWTAYESPNVTDWLEIDFGEAKKFARVELGIYDDRGGVQPPGRYDIQFWDGKAWRDVADAKKTPEVPTGGVFNEVRFAPVTASKVRIVFTHAGKSRSGVTEVFVWAE
jgi:hypothetical protein